MEIIEPEIDVGALMHRIRDAASRMHVSHLGQIKTSHLYGFQIKNKYHLSEFERYQDDELVINCYRAILKRDPDEQGLNHHLQSLRLGKVNKIQLIGGLRYSPEGQKHKVIISRLFLQYFLKKILFKLPFIRYIQKLKHYIWFKVYRRV